MTLIDKAVAHARADATTPAAADDKLDKLLSGLGAITARMDSDQQTRKDADDKVMGAIDAMGKRLDACEADTKARKDAEEKEEKERKDSEEQKARKDAEEKEEKEKKERTDAEEAERKRADAARGTVDPTVAAQIKELQARIPTELSAADRALYVGAQVKAERVAQAFGDSEGAPRWMNGESLPDYQRRLLGKYKAHSAAWKDKDLARVDASVLDVAETAIYADAITAAASPASIATGTLREVITEDRTGRRISRFYGDPEACWRGFKQPLHAATGIRTNFHHG